MNKSADEIIEQLGGLIRGVWTHSENPELLSKDLNDIAVLSWALSQWQAQLDEAERTMKTAFELEKAKLLDKLTTDGTAVNKAEIRVTLELTKMRQEYNATASALEKVKITNRANQSVMDAVRSRLSLIKEEIKR